MNEAFDERLARIEQRLEVLRGIIEHHAALDSQCGAHDLGVSTLDAKVEAIEGDLAACYRKVDRLIEVLVGQGDLDREMVLPETWEAVP